MEVVFFIDFGIEWEVGVFIWDGICYEVGKGRVVFGCLKDVDF